MASGLSRRKLLAFFGLLALPWLSACGPDEGSTVTWSPSGAKVAFLSAGRPWVYDLASGAVREIPIILDGATQMAWSAKEGTLAVSTNSAVEILRMDKETFVSVSSVSLAGANPADCPCKSRLSWHPADLKLLVTSGEYNWAATTGIELSSTGVKNDMAGGVGMFGPDGRWTLWSADIFLGNSERKLYSRQGEGEKPLPLSKSDERTMEASDRIPGTLCFSSPYKKSGSRLRCLDAAGRLASVARFPHADAKNLYPNRARTLFAESDWEKESSMRLRILDRDGKVVADGGRVVELVRSEIPQAMTAGEKPEAADNRYSGIAWSPNGEWLAWTVNGRLCLWNWRNDVVRILPALPQ